MTSLTKEGQEKLVFILARGIQLHKENEQLKKEVKSRRHQGDVWRKRAQEDRLKLIFIQMYLGKDKSVDQALEEVGYRPKRRG